MAAGGVNLDDLIAARAKLEVEKGKPTAPVQAVDELTFVQLLGLWAVLTLFIVIRAVTGLLEAIARAVEAYNARPRPVRHVEPPNPRAAKHRRPYRRRSSGPRR